MRLIEARQAYSEYLELIENNPGESFVPIKEWIDGLIIHTKSDIQKSFINPPVISNNPSASERFACALFCALSAEILSLVKLEEPAWVKDKRGFLDKPFFSRSGDKDALLATTSVQYRARNLFIYPLLNSRQVDAFLAKLKSKALDSLAAGRGMGEAAEKQKQKQKPFSALRA